MEIYKVMKRTMVLLLAFAIAFTTCATSAFAEDDKKAAEKKLKQQLKAAKAIPIETNSLTGWPQGPKSYAESGIVMDMDTGAIVYGKNINAKQYPASITKLMTVLVALENAQLSDTVEFSKASIDFLEYGDAQIGMKVGEKITLEQALYAVLLASANEVSYAVAESVGKLNGGDYQWFIDKMNEKATELGCTGSHFVNPNGLHDDNHYVTAHDMALIGRAVYQKEEFRTIENTYEYKIPKTNKSKEKRVFQQNHKMTYDGNIYYYKYCTGGKTGYTDQAHTTLVTFAEKDGMKLVDVNLCSYGVNVYKDTRKMLDYAFDNFAHTDVSIADLPENVASITEGANVTLPSAVTFEQLSSEVEESGDDTGENMGVIHYTYEKQPVGDVAAQLIAATPSPEPTKEPAKKSTAQKSEKTKDKKGYYLLYGLCGLWGGLVVLFFVLLIRAVVIRRKKKRNRRK